MITIKRIDETNCKDINIPNEPFVLSGKMIPTYDGAKWDYSVENFEPDQISEMVFPDEDYDFNEMKEEYFFVGAYEENDTCIGLAIYKRDWFKYLYLDDLKIGKANRGHGIGKMLLAEGDKIAAENKYRGIYTIGQDNNLNACMFYVKSGFEIGGLNTNSYKGTSQEGKSDIYFYRDTKSLSTIVS